MTTWRPTIRHCVYQPKPDWIPDWVYTEAAEAKKFYNEQWEFWVWMVAEQYNCTQAIAEDACIRGLKTALDRIEHVYGGHVSKWYHEFLDMDDLLDKVRHPQYERAVLEGVSNDGRR